MPSSSEAARRASSSNSFARSRRTDRELDSDEDEARTACLSLVRIRRPMSTSAAGRSARRRGTTPAPSASAIARASSTSGRTRRRVAVRGGPRPGTPARGPGTPASGGGGWRRPRRWRTPTAAPESPTARAACARAWSNGRFGHGPLTAIRPEYGRGHGEDVGGHVRLAGDLGGLGQVRHGHRPRVDLPDREALVAEPRQRAPGVVGCGRCGPGRRRASTGTSASVGAGSRPARTGRPAPRRGPAGGGWRRWSTRRRRGRRRCRATAGRCGRPAPRPCRAHRRGRPGWPRGSCAWSRKKPRLRSPSSSRNRSNPCDPRRQLAPLEVRGGLRRPPRRA